MDLDSQQSERSSSGTRLCDRCQVIWFDEKALDGFMSTSEEGHPILESDNDSWLQFDLPFFREDVLPDLPRLKESAEEGCEFCKFLRGAIIRTDFEHKEECGNIMLTLYYIWGVDRSGNRAWRGKHSLNGLVVDIEGPEGESSSGSRISATLPFLICSNDGMSVVCFSLNKAKNDSEDSIRQWLHLDRLPRNDRLCSENVKFISNAISRCHENCAHGQPDFLPKRLIDISPESGDEQPRLIITEKAIATTTVPGHCHRYAALSYCWGDAALQLKTESATLSQNLQSIPIETMPEVMRDAVAICRALSIRYLWIDSLCIIQDNKSDWEQESEVMGLIYQSAFLTICAVSSDSCHRGFLTGHWRKS